MPAFNILYFSSFGHLRWGGQKSLFLLETNLNRDRYTPHVLVPSDEDLAASLRQRGVDVIVLDLPPLDWRRPGPILKSLRYLNRIIGEKNIRLLHTDGPRNTFYASLAAKWRRIPLVWHVRSSEKDYLDSLLVPLCDRIILVADAVRGRFLNGVNEKKFITIYNGVDLKEFDDAVSSSIRSEYGIDKDTVLLGSFARIDPMKGQLGLIEACSALHGRIPFKLFLFGEIHDADYHRACLKAALRLGVDQHVIFAGHRSDVASLLKAIDIVVLNSYREAFPRSVIEAMAAARPVVATSVGGTSEAIENGTTGFIISPGDNQSLCDRIMKLAIDPFLRERLGREGRKRAETLFSLETNIRNTERVYEQLISASHVGKLRH